MKPKRKRLTKEALAEILRDKFWGHERAASGPWRELSEEVKQDWLNVAQYILNNFKPKKHD